MPIAADPQAVREQALDRTRRAAHANLLDALADHVGAPSHDSWLALKARAGELDDLAEFMFERRWVERVGPLSESLIARDEKVWTDFAVEILAHGGGLLSSGPGARLKALGPFAGKALVTYRGGVAGEVNALFRSALERAGADVGSGASYLIALDPDAVSLSVGASVHSA